MGRVLHIMVVDRPREVGMACRTATQRFRPVPRSGRRHWRTLLVWGVAGVMAPSVMLADSTAITFRDAPTHLFPDVTVTVTVQVAVEPQVHGRLTWDFHAAGALVQRGESSILPASSGKADVVIPLVIPPARATAAIEARLRATFWPQNSPTNVAAVRSFWIMGPVPWEGRREWLTHLGIQLFDPEGTTGPLFEESDIPFTATRNPEALVGGGRGVLVIAEGMDFRDYRGLPATMMAVAASGMPVIGLAPAGGTFDLACLVGSLPGPRSFQLFDPSFLRDLDKRLAPAGWTGEKDPILSYFVLSGEPPRVVISDKPVAASWAWLEVIFPAPSSRLVVTGHAIARNWNTTPAARHLFLRLLERVTGLDQAQRGDDPL